MPESDQSCFELSIHFPVFFSRELLIFFSSSSRLVLYTDKCIEMSKLNKMLSSTATSLSYFVYSLHSA